jgi:PAS domain S-box-containing protein
MTTHDMSNYMAHGFCLLWEPGLIRLHVISDIITGVAYYTIAIALFYFLYKRRDIPFPSMFVLFSLFILACGTTHLSAAYTIYVPKYWEEGLIKAFTAFISIIASILLIPLLPKAIALPSLTNALDDNKRLSGTLETQVEELFHANQHLQNEVAERRQTEEALFSAEKKFRDLLESIQLAAVMLDVEGNLTFCNNYILSLTGWSREEVLGKNWFDLFIPVETRGAVHDVFKSAIDAGTLQLRHENTIVTRNGEQRLLAWDNSILRNTEGSIIGVASIGTDITEHKKLEEQLCQAQKMEAIGELAGGVAHDFNNILSAIVGYAALTQMKMKTEDPLRPHIEQILASSERATGLTKSLLAFSRKQVIELKPVDVNEMVFGFHKLLARLIGEDIVFRVIPAHENLMVEADKGQLEQVLMNLATNARDAMPKGGTLEVKTDMVTFDTDQGAIKRGTYAVLSVSDTGFGMDKTTQEHIYEPFFTTKEVGKGTGLGLAIVYGIVQKHNGIIHLYSEPGVGTTFKIYLPLIPSAVKQVSHASSTMPPMGTETILLVEDDDSVRAVTKAMLEEFGYTVVEAANGEDAVKLFRENKDKIQLVLCDLIMPIINGKETFKQIIKIRPHVKVIFISGYTSDIIAQKGIIEDGVDFISKPLNPSDLFNKIRDVLES